MLRRMKRVLSSEKGLSFLALLPFFFNWILVLSFSRKTEMIIQNCIYAALFSIYFFLFVLLSFILHLIPFGNYIAAHIHAFAVVFYISFSIIFIYSLMVSKKMVIKPIDRHHRWLVGFFNSAHSSAG